MRKILTSIFVIALVAGATYAGTSAFFSDVEVSEGNTLVAGDIDLQIDNESYAIDWNIPDYSGTPSGKFVASTHTSWDVRNLTVERFFDFVDLKPGDYGEDTISVHVGSNDAWVCAAAQITEDNDNTYVDPELDDDPTVGNDPLLSDGELDEEVNFAFWVDDGDNVFESDETVFLDGPISALGGAGQIALADSNGSVLGDNIPVPGGETFYIGKYWCFGEMEETPVAQGEGSPIDRNATGFSCDGASVNNASQTDIVVADLQFYAEQSRNNEQFSCSDWTPESQEEQVNSLILENKNPNDWDEVLTGDERSGVLTWEGDGPTFDFSNTFEATGLDPNTEYSLIYAPDPWPQGIGEDQSDGTGTESTLLGDGVSNIDGDLLIQNEVDLGYDLPHPNDANHPTGAKIWLVLSSDHNGTEMTKWNPTEYLFETDFIQYDDTDN